MLCANDVTHDTREWVSKIYNFFDGGHILLEEAQLARSTYYYHEKRLTETDKYGNAKEAIAAIYHKNKGCYGYRRIAAELRKRGLSLNHKTVQRLMKQLGLVCRVRMKKYCSYLTFWGQFTILLSNLFLLKLDKAP